MIILGSGDIVLGIPGGGVTSVAFTPRTGDLTIPIVSSFSPLDGASDVVVDVNLVIIFNEDVRKGIGNITIKKTSDDSVVETIDVTSELVNISGGVVTVNPSGDLPGATDCYILIDSGALEDLSANDYVGISAKTIWNFIVETTFSGTISTFGNLTPDATHKWVGGAVAANGSIYGAPYLQGSILKVITSTEVTSEIGSYSDTWCGGAYDTVNGCVYFAPYGPYGAKDVLKIDSSDDSVSTHAVSGELANGAWFGLVRAANGYIYGIPYSATTVLKIDPSDDSISVIGNLSGAGKWMYGILADNGCIYGIPYYATTVLKIDTSDDTISTFGSLSGNAKWSGGVFVSANGCIYCAPFNSTIILKIDTSDDSTSTFGSYSGDFKWSDACLAADDIIYCIPYNSTTVLKIDPSDNSSSVTGSLSGEKKWGSGVVAPNGNIYGITRYTTTMLKIE